MHKQHVMILADKTMKKVSMMKTFLCNGKYVTRIGKVSYFVVESSNGSMISFNWYHPQYIYSTNILEHNIIQTKFNYTVQEF